MFDSLRDTFHSVQENLSASLRGLSVGDSVTKSPSSKSITQVNLSAGAEVLEKFQSSWEQLHSLSQENASKAQEVDQLIGKLHKRLEKQWTDLGQTGTALARIPQVVYSVTVLTEQLGSLEKLFEDVEKALIELENVVETRELQEQQLDHRFQLALYKEKKLGMLENVRVGLAKEHADKVKQHEVRQHRIMRERQEAFENQFKQDVEIYKETNTLPKIDLKAEKKVTKENSLEEVLLDSEGTEALDEFLQDESASVEQT